MLDILWQNEPSVNRYVAIFSDNGTLSESNLRKYLSVSEREQAAALDNVSERRNFIARRSFQRLFLCNILAFDKPPSELAVLHRRDSPPKCPDAPNFHLSFSSSGNTAIACASSRNPVGIDIEQERQISNAVALAKRFFSPSEADALAAMPPAEQGLHFLHHWTAKEAALKATGKGIVDGGLNTFTVCRKSGSLTYDILGPGAAGWSLNYLELLPKYIIALVEKNPVGNT